MKPHLASLLVLGLCACQRKEAAASSSGAVHPPEVQYPQFKSAWVMSSGWLGYMGVAIALTEDRYYYAMYSDVATGAHYPYTGSYTVDQGVLRLGPPDEVTPAASGNPGTLYLYSNAWKFVGEPQPIHLHAVSDKPDDHARTLVFDAKFDPRDPFRNQETLAPPPRGPGSERSAGSPKGIELSGEEGL